MTLVIRRILVIRNILGLHDAPGSSYILFIVCVVGIIGLSGNLITLVIFAPLTNFRSQL